MSAPHDNGAGDRVDPELITQGFAMLSGAVSVETGQSDRDVVWTRNKTTLYRYRPLREHAHEVPVLLVYALINRPYIFDLRPENSFVGHLLEEGFDVFLLDWGRPGWEDRNVTLDVLVGEHLPAAVVRMQREAGTEEHTLFGYCMGGTFAMIAAALAPAGVRNLVALTAPVDFTEAGAYSLWTDPEQLDADEVARSLGNIPASLIDFGNKMQRPVANFVGAPAIMWERLLAGKDMTSWLAMNQWVNDGVPFPGAAFAQWIRDCYQENRLASGGMSIAGEVVDLGRIDASVLAIAGAKDHIVPPAMAKPLLDLVSSDDREYLELDAGHVGLLAGSGARATLWPTVTEWLSSRSGARAATRSSSPPSPPPHAGERTAREV